MIVVGELANPKVARMVMAAVESGRKVLAAMTGASTTHAVSQLISIVSQDEKEGVLSRVAAALEGVIAQQLAKTRDGTFRPAVEVFRGGLNSTKPIVEGRIKDLNFFIESRQGGMQSLDQHLLELHLAGLISGTETMRLANNPEAVGVGLRAARQVSAASSTTGSSPSAPNPLNTEPGLAP